MELYKIYINYDPGMTLTYFTARSIYSRLPIHKNGKIVKMSFEGKDLKELANGLKIYEFEKKMTTWAGLLPPRDNIHV